MLYAERDISQMQRRFGCDNETVLVSCFAFDLSVTAVT